MKHMLIYRAYVCGTITLLLVALCSTAQAQSFKGGTGTVTTEVFQTTGPWRLKWDFQGSGLKVFVHHADTSKAVGEPIRQALNGSGVITMEKAGRFYLKIISVGDYKLSVIQDEGTVSSLPKYSGNTESKGSPIFDGPQGWGYRVSSQGSVLEVTLFDAERRQVGQPVHLIGGGSVTRKVGTPGKYFFMFKSVGPYEVELFKE
jgi:hypothetical protein